jgi:putative chitinase
MCISQPVGRNAIANRDNTTTLQVLLNLNLDKLIGIPPLSEDGIVGPRTIGAIEEFQRRVVGLKTPDGRVDPNGLTLRKLREGIAIGLTERHLRGIMIHATPVNIAKYFPGLKQNMAANGIDRPLRQAHFLAQIAHESAELRYSEEIASGAAYEGRVDLGNTQPGDGVRFKGRGLIQLTGRANYTKYGKARHRDFMTGDNAKLIATDPALAVDVACWFWMQHELNTLADNDDVVGATRVINGGLNGLSDRQTKLVRAKFFLVR